MVNLTLVSAFLFFAAIIHICSAQTPTLSASITQATLVTGNSQYKLLGCYSELVASPTGRAVGLNGEYIIPLFDQADSLTVENCLTACSENLTPNTKQPYIYAAVEFSKECFCGFTFSNESVAVSNSFCSSRCSGDRTQSCGGVGYLTLYGPPNVAINPKLTSAAPFFSSTRLASSTSSSAITTTNTTTTSNASTASSQSSNGLSTPAKAGIIIGTILSSLLLLVFLLLYLRRRSRISRMPHQEHNQDHDHNREEDESTSFANGALHRGNALRRPTKTFEEDPKKDLKADPNGTTTTTSPTTSKDPEKSQPPPPVKHTYVPPTQNSGLNPSMTHVSLLSEVLREQRDSLEAWKRGHPSIQQQLQQPLDATIPYNPREARRVVELGSEGPHVLMAELEGSEGGNVSVVHRTMTGLSSDRERYLVSPQSAGAGAGSMRTFGRVDSVVESPVSGCSGYWRSETGAERMGRSESVGTGLDKMGKRQSAGADRFGYRECVGEGPYFESPLLGKEALKGKGKEV